MNRIARSALAAVATTAFAGAAVIGTSTAASANGVDIGWPAPGTGGLILRDETGRDLGSGIGEDQDFRFIKCGPEGSGLIYVKQIKRHGGGGWGDLYEGYVKQKYAQVPGMFPCHI